MHTFLHKKFLANLMKFPKDKTSSLIAISGGQDSLCLIKLIYDCFKSHINNFEAIYIDHQWQKDSLRHSKHIANMLNTINMPITIYQIKQTNFSEAEARKIRYKILIQHACNNNIEYIITAHNKDDQMETLLQKLIRSSSLNGITSFTGNKKVNFHISILRPLLNFNKAEIRWFCKKFCLPIWSDKSNYNYKIQRNRLRYELIPYLKKYFNPQINESINSFIDTCRIDNEYIKENAIKLYIKSKHNKFIGLNLSFLKTQHKSLQIRTLQIYFNYHFNIHITNQYIADILIRINQKQNMNSIFFFNTLIIQQIDGWLYTNFRT